MSLSHWLCIHCEGWGCRRCLGPPPLPPTPAALAELCPRCGAWGCPQCRPDEARARRSGEQGETADEARLYDLRRQVVTMQVALVEAQCAAAVAQRELEDVRRVLAAMVGAVKRGES